MYRCEDCGNTEKFIGFVSEEGDAYIYQDNESGGYLCEYTWAYFSLDKDWKSNLNVKSCYFCNSENITKI